MEEIEFFRLRYASAVLQLLTEPGHAYLEYLALFGNSKKYS